MEKLILAPHSVSSWRVQVRIIVSCHWSNISNTKLLLVQNVYYRAAIGQVLVSELGLEAATEVVSVLDWEHLSLDHLRLSPTVWYHGVPAS